MQRSNTLTTPTASTFNPPTRGSRGNARKPISGVIMLGQQLLAAQLPILDIPSHGRCTYTGSGRVSEHGVRKNQIWCP